jgi:phosphatidylserine decarboxylase
MPAAEPIQFFHRYTGRVETEAVYGEAWLRWTYGTLPGRLALHAVAKRAWFSRWYGRRMDRPASARRIAPFIAQFGLDPAEFADPPASFRTFNEFFFRRLRPGARPLHPDPRAIVFPADGRHLAVPDMDRATGFFVKGQRLDLRRLLGADGLATAFAGGTAVLSRLCPVDYHRFHFSVAGSAAKPRLINGPLFSVSPIALRRNLAILWENRRWLTLLETPALGRMAMLEIGATNVGSAEHTFAPGPVERGQEKGFFRFGGSAVLTLFGPGRVRLADDLREQSAQHRELYAHVGDVMAWAAS